MYLSAVRSQPMWAVIAVGLLVLYVPSFTSLASGLWQTDQQGHGPIVLALGFWLLWRQRHALLASDDDRPQPLVGWLLLLLAGIIYVLGRSQGILILEIGSLPMMLTAVLLLLRGTRQVRAMAFGLFFLIFMVPLPGAVVDMLTQPMKILVSYLVERILSSVGYPIARSGVILQIGPYQLLVADACAGLQSLFTLEALGLLYLNVVRHTSWLRNLGLAILIVPISISANTLRVIVLTLITYHFGDEAGQGFLHGFAGMVLFLSALMLIISADTALRVLGRREPRPKLTSVSP